MDVFSVTDVGLIILYGFGIVDKAELQANEINIHHLIKNILSRKRILIVDDNEDTLQVYSEILQEEGYFVQSLLREPPQIDLENNIFKYDYDLLIFKFGLPDFDCIFRF